MNVLDVIALLILIIAIGILFYYYLNDTKIGSKLSSSVPNLRNFSAGGWNTSDDNISVSEKLKTKIKDIDMPNINTDAFSNRLDAFLNEKSEELIKDWELATKEDISVIEKKFDVINNNIDDVNKRFKEYKDFTNEKLDDVDERLKKLEEDN
ncbi:MAG: hypothetical protein LBT66_00395 [Methanobrevibacter sp.]|jgi:hypothetical protein|nr:hypothetical protein [Candidatus Methanovirga meridionalis]